MDIYNEQEKACAFIEKTIKENQKISHAYFIETNGYKNYLDFVKYMIKLILCSTLTNNKEKTKIINAIDHNNYPDIQYIYPEGNYIKKEQLLNLEKEFSKKSMLDNKLIYVINEAEKLNDSSANTILKFLEEPEENIIAIIVANNRYKVIETILSRCQIISLSNNNINIDINDYTEEFLNDLIKTKKLIINYDLYLENLFSDKKSSIDTLENIELLFYNYLNEYTISKSMKTLLDQSKNEDIIKYILIINDFKNKLEYNLNIKLWLMNLIVELLEVK